MRRTSVKKMGIGVYLVTITILSPLLATLYVYPFILFGAFLHPPGGGLTPNGNFLYYIMGWSLRASIFWQLLSLSYGLFALPLILGINFLIWKKYHHKFHVLWYVVISAALSGLLYALVFCVGSGLLIWT